LSVVVGIRSVTTTEAAMLGYHIGLLVDSNVTHWIKDRGI